MEEGWVHPVDPGPHRRHVLALLAAGTLLVLAWALFGTGWLGERLAPKARDVVVAVSADGAVMVDGRAVDAELRERAGVAFLVAAARLRGDRPVRVRTRTADGVGEEQVVVRQLLPSGTARGGRLLVLVPADALPELRSVPTDPDSLPSLRARTDPFDARMREVRDDRELRDRLRRSWWWIAPLVLLVALGGPLLGWRRMRRRTFDQRVPGPGRAPDLEPPSSLDPVGAAILVAGARPPDAAAAFAGHVLDLVERRQLPMRRSTTAPPGPGTLLGMHHADELDDLAVELLSEIVPLDETNVFLPDSTRSSPVLAPEARRRWKAHLDARAGFERLVERPPVARLRGAAVLLVAVAVVAALVAVTDDLQGRVALALLVAAAATIAGAAVATWSIDAARWRTVARGRRTERAQWIAWRDAQSVASGATVDERSLPVLVATGRDLPGVRAVTTPEAVNLAAVTTRTVAALRALVDPTR